MRKPLQNALLGVGFVNAAIMALALGGCTPTVKIEPSDKPIIIALNVKIDQEVRVRLDKAAEELIANNPDLF